MDNNKKVSIADRKGSGIFKPLFNAIVEKARYASRGQDRGIVNNKSKSSIAMRKNGDITMAAGGKSQEKLAKSGKKTAISHQGATITNEKRVATDSLVINGHRLNPALYEMTDLKNGPSEDHKLVGGLTMMGTVLVKAWEPTLKRYVMIRRLANMPVFSPELNTPDAHKNFSIDTSLQEEFDGMADIEKMSDMLIEG